jgi:hypothetical protein
MLLAGTAAAPLTGGLDLPRGSRAPVHDGFLDVRDEPYARALVLDDGERLAALVQVDLFAVDPDLVQRAAHRLWDDLRIAPEAVLVVPTGVTTAPLAATFLGPTPRPEAYCGYVAEQIASAAAYAARARRPAAVAWTRAASPLAVAFDQPLLGPLVMRVDDLNGDLIALLLELPALPGETGRVLSADYPGEAVRFLADGPGAELVGLLGPAAGVDLPGVDISEQGQRLAALAWAAALEVETDPGATVHWASANVELSLGLPDPDESAARLERAEQRVAEAEDPLFKRAALGELARAREADELVQRGGEPTRAVDLQAIVVGDGVVVGSSVLLSPGAAELATAESSYGERTLLAAGCGGLVGVLTTPDQPLPMLELWHAPVPFAPAATGQWAAAVGQLAQRVVPR